MKTFLVALVLALVLSYGCALKCNHCVPQSGTHCVESQETCSSKQDGCVTARIYSAPFAGFRRCGIMRECSIYETNLAMKIRCCQSDLCNKVIY